MSARDTGLAYVSKHESDPMLVTVLSVDGAPESSEHGQTSVEYAAVLLLVAVALVTALALGLTGVVDGAVNAIKNAV